MNTEFTLFVVDDDEFALNLLVFAFGQECRLEAFATAEDCLARLDQEACPAPDLFLLDVDLPGLDGYALCRQIKARPGNENALVIFISGLDDLESRLRGYDAGGVDYVVKPYAMDELREKVRAARRRSLERSSFDGRLQESKLLAMLVVSNMGEYAVLIGFLRALNECINPRALLESLFNLLRSYGLECAIQLRLPGVETTLSQNGENVPLEVAVIKHVRSLERIFEFKTRAVFNFEHLTILVNNLPQDDPDLCGRLRDHLAIAAECTNAKLQALLILAENRQARSAAADGLDALQHTVHDFEQKYVQARCAGSMLTQDLLDELSAAFSSLGLSESQEARIEGIVQAKACRLAEIYDFSGHTQEALRTIAENIACIVNPAAVALDRGAGATSVMAEEPRPAVELF